ncbi:MAG: hypothetical protein RLW61_22350 [Gammaproteobacteria bacterium]
MKKITAIAIIAAAAGTAQADSFAPWNGPRIEDRVDAEQATVVVRPYYRSDVASGRDASGEPAAQVIVKPWYAGDRV